MTLFNPTPAEKAVTQAIAELRAGRPASESRHLDLKSATTRHGAPVPDPARDPALVRQLAPEVACMANTPGGGALVLGVGDDSTLEGTTAHAEWLRREIYTQLQSRVTCDVREVFVHEHRLLVLLVPEAVEPVKVKGRIQWRIDDGCHEVDASTWRARMDHARRVDWSARSSQLPTSRVRPSGMAAVRTFLEDTRETAARDLAQLPDEDLLRRLNAVDVDGFLTNAAALLFVGWGPEHNMLDYIRRDHAGGDSRERLHRTGLSLAEELQEVLRTCRSFNPLRHTGDGPAVGQVREIPERPLREAIINGVAHRDWAIQQPTTIEHVGATLQVTSPGGFMPGITPDNVIHQPSTSRNTALTELLAAIRVAEREGIGIDRMYQDMLSHGHPEPSLQELATGAVRTRLVANVSDQGWLEWLHLMDQSWAVLDLDTLMTLRQLVTRGWTDHLRLAPYVQRPPGETIPLLQRVAELTMGGDAVTTMLSSTPAGGTPAMTLSKGALRALAHADSRSAYPVERSTRPTLALDFARSRGRISSSELGEMTGIASQTAGRVLRDLEEQGELLPSRANRRGAGFHYLPAPPREDSHA